MLLEQENTGRIAISLIRPQCRGRSRHDPRRTSHLKCTTVVRKVPPEPQSPAMSSRRGQLGRLGRLAAVTRKVHVQRQENARHLRPGSDDAKGLIGDEGVVIQWLGD